MSFNDPNQNVFHHSTNFLLTNYSFGKLVRTSTLCMTQAIFPTIVNRQIISLYHNSCGSDVYIHQVDCAFKQLGKFQKIVISLEASDRLIDIIYAN